MKLPQKILGNRVFCRIVLTNPMRGSLFVAQKKTMEAIVLMVGEEIKDKFKNGDRVIFYATQGIELSTRDADGNEEYLVLFDEEDLIAKIEKD